MRRATSPPEGDRATTRPFDALPATLRPSAGAVLWSCPHCGTPVTDPQRVRCNACIDNDPGQTSEVRGRRAKAIAARRPQAAAWEAAGGEGTFDPNQWPSIQAGLTGVKLADIMAATGFAKSFASVVRAGKLRPHPAHWPALLSLTERHPRTEGSA